MIAFIFKENKRYLVLTADAFGVSAAHSKLLEDSRNFPYIELKRHKGIKICANRRSLALLYLKDILEDMEDISYENLRDIAFKKLKHKLREIGQIVNGARLLESLYIIYDKQIYEISKTGCLEGINSNYVFIDPQLDESLTGYLDRHSKDDINDTVKGMNLLLSNNNRIRRPPYFIVSLDDNNIERIDL